MWTRALDKVRCARLKPQKRISKRSSGGGSLLSKKEQTSGFGESAAVHYVQLDLTSFSDEPSERDNDPAVVRTMETLSVAGSDALAHRQEKEARSSGGIPSR
jgi:hypothetical protein